MHTTTSFSNSVDRSNRRLGFILTLLLLACVALWSAPKAFGVSPARDGGYPGSNTAEGTDAGDFIKRVFQIAARDSAFHEVSAGVGADIDLCA